MTGHTFLFMSKKKKKVKRLKENKKNANKNMANIP